MTKRQQSQDREMQKVGPGEKRWAANERELDQVIE
jgi:hypothetical protein